MWPKLRGKHGWLLIGTSLLVFVLLGGSPVRDVDGAEVEVTREIRDGGDFGDQARVALAEMIQSLAERGCKTARAYAYSKEEEPGVIVFAVRCLEWHDMAKR